MRAALYVRVSTRDKQNTDTQLLPLRDFAAAKGHELVSEWTDVGYSGAKQSRPGLDAMMAAARRKEFDVLIVARFDRFARSVSHLLRALEEFNKLGIDFISINESIDTRSSMGKLIFTILGAVAEMERNLIKDRVQAGIDRARKTGKRLGRPPKCLYDKQRALTLLNAGRSIKSVAAELGISRPTVTSIKRAAEKQNDMPAETPFPQAI